MDRAVQQHRSEEIPVSSLRTEQQRPRHRDSEKKLKVRYDLTERNNNNNGVGVPRKMRIRELTSRYKAWITGTVAPRSVRRFPSPNVTRVIISTVQDATKGKRAQYTNRRAACGSSLGSNDVETTLKRNFRGRHSEMPWLSTPNLSLSSHPPNKENFSKEIVDHSVKPAPDMDSSLALKKNQTSVSKRSPNASENDKLHEKNQANAKENQKSWPRMCTLKLYGSRLSKSLDLMDRLTGGSTKLCQGRRASGTGSTLRPALDNLAFSQTIHEGSMLVPSDSRWTYLDGSSSSLKGSEQDPLLYDFQEAELACVDGFSGFGDIVSDTESVSSGITSRLQDASGRKC